MPFGMKFRVETEGGSLMPSYSTTLPHGVSTLQVTWDQPEGIRILRAPQQAWQTQVEIGHIPAGTGRRTLVIPGVVVDGTTYLSISREGTPDIRLWIPPGVSILVFVWDGPMDVDKIRFMRHDENDEFIGSWKFLPPVPAPTGEEPTMMTTQIASAYGATLLTSIARNPTPSEMSSGQNLGVTVTPTSLT